jgi:hypothetical protein
LNWAPSKINVTHATFEFTCLNHAVPKIFHYTVYLATVHHFANNEKLQAANLGQLVQISSK